MERLAFGAVCIHRNGKVSFWRDLYWVLFMYIVMLKVDLERFVLFAVCVHRNIKGSFWRHLLWVLFVYIVMLKVPFWETYHICFL